LPAQPEAQMSDDPPTSAEPAPADVEAMCAKLDEAFKAFDDYGLRRTLTDAAAVLRSLSKDAERYRWLREQNFAHEAACTINWNIGHDWQSIDGLDAAIDAALAAKEQK